jgi:hypothetical protein
MTPSVFNVLGVAPLPGRVFTSPCVVGLAGAATAFRHPAQLPLSRQPLRSNHDDPASVAVFALALAALALPDLRAAATDPLLALRSE